MNKIIFISYSFLCFYLLEVNKYNIIKNIYITMAISMSNIYKSSTQKDNMIEELPVIKTTKTSETYDATIKLYDSYEKAVNACSVLFLYPGETHTEFYYKIENNKRVYHCVIAIGNIDSNKGHLYLEDFSNGEQSLLKSIADINKQLAKNTANL